MEQKKSRSLFLVIFALVAINSGQIDAKPDPVRRSFSAGGCKKQRESFQHNIQLQLADSAGFPVVPGTCPNCTDNNPACNGTDTTFWVTLDIVKDGPLVTINIPLINFQIGQVSVNNPFCPAPGAVPGFPPDGGYLYTSDGFLPKNVRPNDLVPVSIVAASNNGMSPVFSFTETTTELPVPPVGYIVQITNAGELQIQCAGTFGNIIPSGPHVLLPCSITYQIKPTKRLCDNITLSNGPTNVTQFTNFVGAALRDNQTNDAFDQVFAWTWGDNSMEVDKTNGVLNCMVAVGSTHNDTLKVGNPIQLTKLTPPFTSIFDHAVTINRTDKDNIIVSYTIFEGFFGEQVNQFCRAVSFDGGKTWPAPYDGINPQPFNGPVLPNTIIPPDCRGVLSDKFGNIWYSITSANNDITTPPIFFVSTDLGVTFTLIYTAPAVPDPENDFYDYPQYCFGVNEQGQYGLYYTATFASFLTGDAFPVFAFIPIHGAGLDNIDVANATFTILSGLSQAQLSSDIAASNDAKVWLQGSPSGALPLPYTYIQPQTIAYQSPSSALDLNWAGSWNQAIINNIGSNYFITNIISQPVTGYFSNATQSIIYDNDRQALYSLIAAQNPHYSQDINIYFIISRDNGMTWSAPIEINNSSFANRGFQSMALDEMTGDLVVGWYDGRNDRSFESVEYMAALIPAKTLTKLVNAIPLSNPTFEVPSVAEFPVTIRSDRNYVSDNKTRSEAAREHFERTFRRK